MRRLKLDIVEVGGERHLGQADDASAFARTLGGKLHNALYDTDIEIEATGRRVTDDARAASNGAAPSWDIAQLHALAAQLQPQAGPSWSALLLVVRGEAPGGGLRGLMLDAPCAGGRRSAAVFAGPAAPAAMPSDKEKKDGIDPDLARTCLHELGHILNLVHPFEIEVGRPGSDSAMNYDFVFQQVAVGPRELPLGFSDVELSHLRLGAPLDVVPGGRAFHSAAYWTRDRERKRVHVPERPAPRAPFRLALDLPRTGGTFALGQPVFLEVALDRSAGEKAYAPPWLLDPKAGQLEIWVRRVPSAGCADATTPTQRFLPIAQRCYSAQAAEVTEWPQRRNLNLTYGNAGFAFPEPGTYEVRAVLRLLAVRSGATDHGDTVVVSDWERLRVAPPTHEQQRELDLLLGDHTGLYWALGGSDALPRVSQALDDYVERHPQPGREIRHPIVANALRCKALNALRRYVRPGPREGRPGEALRLIQALVSSAPACFDSKTFADLDKLGCQLRAASCRAVALPPRKRWTVALYMAAEARNLREAAEADLRELQAARTRSDEPVHVLAQIDEAGPAGAKRYRITQHSREELAPPEPRETNTGDPRTLREFVRWADEHHPADHTLLVLWGHSQGVGFGVDPGVRFLAAPESADFGYDVTSDDALTVVELGRGLRFPEDARPEAHDGERLLRELRRLRRAVLEAGGVRLSPAPAPSDPGRQDRRRPHVDILGFDSCYMSAAEVATELGPRVDRLLASQASTPLAGWDYRAVLREITAYPGIDPAGLGRRLAELSVAWPDRPALTLLNLRRGSDLLARMRALTDAIGQAARDEAERRRLIGAVLETPWFGAREFLDLGGLCRKLESRSADTTVQWTAARVARLLKPSSGGFVEALPSGCEDQCAGGGVSVYCPLVPADGPTAYVDPALYARLRFNRLTGWADLVQSDVLRRRAGSTRAVAPVNGAPNAGSYDLAARLGRWMLAQIGADGASDDAGPFGPVLSAPLGRGLRSIPTKDIPPKPPDKGGRPTPPDF